MKLQSDFAILDVKRGRVGLLKQLEKAGGSASVPVTIVGRITFPHGSDDGVSQEFSVDVDRVTVGEEEGL